MTRQSARFLVSILLIGALIPGATVVCFAAPGHVAVESPFALCCAQIPAPSASEVAELSGPTSDDCTGCTDIPVLATRESNVERIPDGNDETGFAPLGRHVPVNPRGETEPAFSTGVFLTPDLPASSPLRC